ncbi:universal stress protein UspA-like protein [Desulfosporosinus orientis DSM 765]|uniref:Universal stress protein UspA-like protein n=1 Tax=Desulfosporosinus orientis (strain ATCC 19365 / DSM 765 / NCIMB 8382 / VKM B-1628 / Singapore I) TaxID=768706 RepID=G7W599_DESOD|nr:universal stress protein [Desulfosporosinus orientis]AET66327.1 universal stress protein UspA-like protein [Desulfosporosinus orientis DSM 765]
MIDGNPLKVLLYFDGSEHSLSAAVYTANLFNRIPNMNLTIVHVQENVEGAKLENDNLMEIWSSDPITDWQINLLNRIDLKKRGEYSKIIARTNEILFETGLDVKQQVIFANPNIPDIVEAIINYGEKKEFELIIMGTRGPSSLKGLMYGSLAHSVLNKSDIPVLLIKKLPQEFVDRFCSAPSGRSTRAKGRRDHLYRVRSI